MYPWEFLKNCTKNWSEKLQQRTDCEDLTYLIVELKNQDKVVVKAWRQSRYNATKKNGKREWNRKHRINSLTVEKTIGKNESTTLKREHKLES